jgi:hypothetical protein
MYNMYFMCDPMSGLAHPLLQPVLEQPYLNNISYRNLTIGDERKFNEIVIAPYCGVGG